MLTVLSPPLAAFFVFVGVAINLMVPPEVTNVDGRWRWIRTADADSVLAYDAQAFLSGPLGPRDSIRYTAYRNNVLVASPRTKVTDTTFTFVPPLAADTMVRYKVFARVWRVATPIGTFRGDSIDVRPPEPPAPVVDSLRMKQRNAAVRPGGSVYLARILFQRPS